MPSLMQHGDFYVCFTIDILAPLALLALGAGLLIFPRSGGPKVGPGPQLDYTGAELHTLFMRYNGRSAAADQYGTV